MPTTFIETLNGVSKEVEYLTPEEVCTQIEWDIAIEKVRDYHRSNEGVDQKDALIQCLDKSIINEVEYDLLYPTIMNDDLYGIDYEERDMDNQIPDKSL